MNANSPEVKELIEAAENSVYWVLREHASNKEIGVCDEKCPPPAYITRLQDALRPFRATASKNTQRSKR